MRHNPRDPPQKKRKLKIKKRRAFLIYFSTFSNRTLGADLVTDFDAQTTTKPPTHFDQGE
jgi:hypothetical protein